MKRGDVRWYKFSRPDKRRPVVILSPDPRNEAASDVISHLGIEWDARRPTGRAESISPGSRSSGGRG